MSVTALALATFALSFLNWARGPYAVSLTGDFALATLSRQEKLVFTSDQMLDEATDVVPVLAPQGVASARVEGRSLVMALERPLLNDTNYVITARVMSASGREGSLRGEFTTPKATVTALERADFDPERLTPASDRIMSRTLGDSDAFTVFSAPQIQEFAEVPSGWVVVVAESPLDSALVFQPSRGGPPANISLDLSGRIEDLKSSGTTGLIGFTFTPDNSPRGRTVMVGNPQTAEPPRAVLDQAGKPFWVFSWLWIPNSTSLVIQDESQMLWLVETAGEVPPVPLGRHTELKGFLPGRDELLVADPTQGTLIDFVTGEKVRADIAPDKIDDNQNPKVIRVLGDKSSSVRIVSTLIDISQKQPFSYDVRRVDASGTKILVSSLPNNDIFRSLCVSPNEQYFALVKSAPGSQPDARVTNPGFSMTSTLVARLADGEPLQEIPGVFDAWCTE